MQHLWVATFLVLLAVNSTACQSPSGGEMDPATPARPIFPVHQEPLGTDLGFDYLAGELRAEDGCLKLYRMGWDDPKRIVSEQLRDIWLPVWPSGFALRQDGDDTQVIDGDGVIVARAGDTVRFGGRSYWSDGNGQEELEKTVPKACQGLYYLVGDEVSVVAPDEARVVRLPGSTLWFPRSRTSGNYPHPQWLAESPRGRPLTLDGDCLRVGKDGPAVIWPTGFYPDMMNGRVVVRNGGGRVVAVVGQEMKLDSGGYITGNSGLCVGPLWGSTRFLELPDRETLGPAPTKASLPTTTPASTPATTLSTPTERPEPTQTQDGIKVEHAHSDSVPIISEAASLFQDYKLPPQSVQDFVNRSHSVVIGTVSAISDPVVELPYFTTAADFEDWPEEARPFIEVAYWTIEIEQMLLDDGNIEANPQLRMEPNPPHRTDKRLPRLGGRYLFTLGRNPDSLSYGISADWMILNLDSDEMKDISGTVPGIADGVREAVLVEEIKEAAKNHEYLPPGQWPDRFN